MDVVYVIGTGSQWNNNELRYSLRSICRYGLGLGRVFIVGDALPSFINPDKVTYILSRDDPGGTPARNVFGKLCDFFRECDVEDVLLSSDDHFFIKPTDFNIYNYPIMYKGSHMPLPGEKGIGGKVYTQTMIDTGRFMMENDLDLRYFEGHTNKWYNRTMWYHMLSFHMTQWMYFDSKYGISTNAPMAALLMKHSFGRFKCEYRKDVKLKHLNTPEDWKELENANCFSIYDSAIKTGVADYLAGLFPDPCYFELQFAPKTHSSATKLS